MINSNQWRTISFSFSVLSLWNPKYILHTAAAKSLQSCPTLCDPRDDSPPGSPVPGILQARTLEWVAISSSNAWKWKVKVKSLSRVRPSATPWTAAHQAPPSMGFSRQESWSGVPLPSPIFYIQSTSQFMFPGLNSHMWLVAAVLGSTTLDSIVRFVKSLSLI